MPRNGSGQYNPLTNTWNPPVTGVLATGADFQAQLNDISAALTQSVSRDGQTPMTASLPMGNNSIVGIASGTETSPSISANGDTNTGLYFPAADTVGVAVGGVNVGNFTSAGFSGNLVNGNATLAAGTVSTPSLTTTGDTNTGLYFPAADTVAIATGGVKRVEVDASGNVGVGVTPSAWVSSAGAIDIGAWANIANTANGFCQFGWNNYESSAGVFKYKATAAASAYRQVSGVHAWYTAPSGTAGNAISFTQAMTLDTSGNLLVGITLPSSGYRLNVGNGASAGGTSIDAILLRNNGFGGANIAAINQNNLVLSQIDFGTEDVGSNTFDDGIIRFITRQDALAGQPLLERARITSRGALLVGTTVVPATGNVNGTAIQADYAGDTCSLISSEITTSNSYRIVFLNGNGLAGSITTNGSSTTYNTSSDYRLKENIQPMTDALAKVAQLKPCTYTWKADGSDGEGFIAHELAEVVPSAVVGEKDAVNDDGSIRPQGIDTSFLVATLTAALQEAHGLIKNLQVRITALEAK